MHLATYILLLFPTLFHTDTCCHKAIITLLLFITLINITFLICPTENVITSEAILAIHCAGIRFQE